MKRVGIIGSGGVGKILALGFKTHGYEARIGTRDSGKIGSWAQEHGIAVGTFDEAADFGEILVLAVKGAAAVDALRLAGEKHLNGKTILDATNPIDDQAGPEEGVLSFFTKPNESLMERLQAEFPATHFVKAFNSVGAGLMVNPEFNDGTPTMFIAGNDIESKQEATEILTKFGWDVEDMGTAVAARAIEPLCILWCIPGFLENRWTHAFKLLKK